MVAADDDEETHLGDGVIDCDAAFGRQAASTKNNPSLGLRMTHNRRWTTDRVRPEVIEIVRFQPDTRGGRPGNDASSSSSSSQSPTGLELRRHARICRKPIELVYRKDPSGPTEEHLLAVIFVVEGPAGREAPASFAMAPATASATTLVYGPAPAFPGQVPTRGGGDLPDDLYLRARIRMAPSRTSHFEYAASIGVVVSAAAAAGGVDGGPGMVWYETRVVPGPTGPQTVLHRTTTKTKTKTPQSAPPAAVFSAHGDGGSDTLDVTVAPGIDPCLVACLAADRMNRVWAVRRRGQTNDFLGNLASCCC